jgi:hypothetical protein
MKKSFFPAVAAIVLCLAVFFGGREILRRSAQGVSEEKLAVSFTSYISGIRGFQRIQLAEVSAVEIIERTSEYSVFWDMLKLPDVVVQARIPVRYLYFVDLSEPFDIRRENGKLIIHAPPLRAATPAPDISGMSYEVKKGSLFRDTRTALEELRKTITPLLQENAEKSRQLVREEARQQLASLVKTWMLQSKDLTGEIQNVHVSFPDEGQMK